MTSTVAPRAHLSTYMDGGARQWTVLYRGAPVCSTLPDEARARLIYADLRKRSAEPLPEVPPIWDGDMGAYR